MFGKLPDNPLAGNYKQAYLGYASDLEVVKNAASGGIVTAVILHALETGMIDGAVMLKDVHGNPFETTAHIASEPKEVVASAGSKYWPAPVAHLLGEILKREGRFAFVGLPCEILALRKAQMVYKKLREKTAFCIGLYCGGRPTIQGQLFALNKYGFSPEAVECMRYRQGEWPGHPVITTQNGEEIHIPKEQQFPGYASHLFCHPRCLLCHDILANMADISTGDPLRLEGVRLAEEKSLLIARTESGERVLAQALSAGVIRLRPVGIETVLHAQKRPVTHKRRALIARLRIASIFKEHIPVITLSQADNIKPTINDYLSAILVFAVNALSQSRLGQGFLRMLPLHWLVKYNTFSRFS